MIDRFEVDGVPALYAPASGPIRAGIGFRVGFADEPLPRRGITHLLEHLTLHTAGASGYHYNGSTGVDRTYFHVEGSEADVVTFLAGVCASLAAPPVHRLAVEKEILRAEASSRGAGDRMPMRRHGARDYGLASCPEWGLPQIAGEDLRAWVARFFVRQNAVFWVSGPKIPEGLRLTLPDGQRQPVPSASSALPVRPAYVTGGSGTVVWDTVVGRGAAAGILSDVLERELFRALRQEGGLSYAVQADYEPRYDGTAVITAVADALPDKQGAVLGGMIDVLDTMRAGSIRAGTFGADLVAATVERRCARLERADELGTRLPGQALDLLGGGRVRQTGELVAETRAVTVDDVARVAAEAYANGLLLTPHGTTADWAGYTAAPEFSASAVEGVAYPCLDDPYRRVILGDLGVSLADDSAQLVTVRFDECAVMLVFPDGARHLIGTDAMTIHLEPTLYDGLGPAIAEVDARVPEHLHAVMTPRDADDVPWPRTLPAIPAPRGVFGRIWERLNNR